MIRGEDHGFDQPVLFIKGRYTALSQAVNNTAHTYLGADKALR